MQYNMSKAFSQNRIGNERLESIEQEQILSTVMFGKQLPTGKYGK